MGQVLGCNRSKPAPGTTMPGKVVRSKSDKRADANVAKQHAHYDQAIGRQRDHLSMINSAATPLSDAYKGWNASGLVLPQLAIWSQGDHFCGSADGGKEMQKHAAHLAALAGLQKSMVETGKKELAAGFKASADATGVGLKSCRQYIEGEVALAEAKHTLEAAKAKQQKDDTDLRQQDLKDRDKWQKREEAAKKRAAAAQDTERIASQALDQAGATRKAEEGAALRASNIASAADALDAPPMPRPSAPKSSPAASIQEARLQAKHERARKEQHKALASQDENTKKTEAEQLKAKRHAEKVRSDNERHVEDATMKLDEANKAVPPLKAAAAAAAPKALADATAKMKSGFTGLRAAHATFSKESTGLLHDPAAVAGFASYKPAAASAGVAGAIGSMHPMNLVKAEPSGHSKSVKRSLHDGRIGIEQTIKSVEAFRSTSAKDHTYLTVHGPKSEAAALQAFDAALTVAGVEHDAVAYMSATACPALEGHQKKFDAACDAYIAELRKFKMGLDVTMGLLKSYSAALRTHNALAKRVAAAEAKGRDVLPAEANKLATLATSKAAAKRTVEAAVRALSDEDLPELDLPEESLRDHEHDDEEGEGEGQDARPSAASRASAGSATEAAAAAAAGAKAAKLPSTVISVKAVMDGTEAFVKDIVSFYAARPSSAPSDFSAATGAVAPSKG